MAATTVVYYRPTSGLTTPEEMVVNEQFDFLREHYSKCQQTDCPSCARWIKIKAQLMSPFAERSKE